MKKSEAVAIVNSAMFVVVTTACVSYMISIKLKAHAMNKQYKKARAEQKVFDRKFEEIISMYDDF